MRNLDMILRWIAGAVLLLGSHAIYANELRAYSNQGKLVTLTSLDDHFLPASKSAIACSDVGVDFIKAKLWMPGHGHGTTPTKLVKQTDRCTSVEQLNFVMSGTWELRLTMSDQDMVTFELEVR